MDINGIPVERASIAQIQGALFTAELACTTLVDHFRKRIEQYDQQGPTLNAVVTLNENALAEAEALDQLLNNGGQPIGPLHGIPVVIKDCLETTDMPTSFGSEVFADYMASEDAVVVQRLREAGAIIVAKTTLPDWATSWFAYSSRSGETRNPYKLEHDPGGSSGGTGAAVSAAYATVGLGTDCGGSVRLPSSFCNLVGMRATPGMMSRRGCNPLVGVQDTIGPMGRSVEDVARVFDVICGHDPLDPLTVACSIAKPPPSYLHCLRPNNLQGRRVGVVRNAHGSDENEFSAPVNDVMRSAYAQLSAGGATLVDIEIPDLLEQLVNTSLYILKSKDDINAFLAERPHAPANALDEIMNAGRYHKMLDLLEAIAAGPDDPDNDLEYHRAYHAREAFMRLVVGLMDSDQLDALVYPTCQVVPPTRAACDSGQWPTLEFPTNTLIGSQTWMPAMTVPAGLSDSGLPVGLEILARPYDEATVFSVAYGFEQVRGHQCHPASVPLL